MAEQTNIFERASRTKLRFDTPRGFIGVEDNIVPDGACGLWQVETFTVSEREARFANLRAAIGHPLERIVPGTYKRLMHGRDVVMSNTPLEIDMHRAFIEAARGAVLINGLGLGMALAAVLAKPKVREVTVIEIAPEVIHLVGPTFANDPRVTIIEANALTYTPPRGKRYDAVWHDIWNWITGDNLPTMRALHRRYGRRTAWQGSWGREHIR